MDSKLHDDEIPIDIDLVRKLVDSQLPHYAALPLSRLAASGSTNALFRLGDNLLARIPRQSGGSVAINKEQHWLPEIGPHLPVAVPQIVALGEPASGFWADALEMTGTQEAGPDRWYHSDLVAENLLLSQGRLTAVLDFGGLAVGDPTIDLHGAWEVLDAPARQVFRARLQVDDAEWLRGRAWALGIALSCFAYYWETMPGRRRDRLAMIRSVLADAAKG